MGRLFALWIILHFAWRKHCNAILLEQKPTKKTNKCNDCRVATSPDVFVRQACSVLISSSDCYLDLSNSTKLSTNSKTARCLTLWSSYSPPLGSAHIHDARNVSFYTRATRLWLRSSPILNSVNICWKIDINTVYWSTTVKVNIWFSPRKPLCSFLSWKLLNPVLQNNA